jgi:hypothetical protein
LRAVVSVAVAAVPESVAAETTSAEVVAAIVDSLATAFSMGVESCAVLAKENATNSRSADKILDNVFMSIMYKKELPKERFSLRKSINASGKGRF